MSLLCCLSSNFIPISFQGIPILSRFQRLPIPGYCVKVTPKKGKAKSLKATITVKNPALSLKAADVVAVGATEQITATVKPANTKVAFTSSDDTIATVDEKGVVTGVKAGKVTITAKAGKTTKTVDMEVKKVILKDAKQTEVTKIVATVAGDTKDLKAGDFKITNTATNATVAVKAVTVDSKDATKLTIDTFTEMKDAKEYTVTYDNMSAKFTATDGTAANVGISKAQVSAGSKEKVQATLLDKDGVILGYTDLDKNDTSKGNVTSVVTLTKGYQDGSNIYLPAVGDTATIKVTYHSGTFGTDGKETGNIEDTFTVTAVDPSLVNYNFALTISGSAPAWTAVSFKSSDKVKLGADQDAYFRITDDKGNDVANDKYAEYTVESADKTKLIVENTKLANSATAVTVRGVAEGTAYILIKKDDKTVTTLPVTVIGKPVATTLDLSKTSVTVVTGGSIDEEVKVTVKDQYGDEMKTSGSAYTPTVSVLAAPKDAVTTTKDTSGANVTAAAGKVTVKGTTFANDSKDVGSYTLKVTVKVDGKELSRSLNVNVVKNADKAQSYEMRIDTPEVDTTLTKDSNVTDTDAINISVVKLANGGAIGECAKAIYTIKNAKGDTVAYVGEDVTSAAAGKFGTVVSCPAVSASHSTVNDAGYNSGKLSVRPYNVDSDKISKNLPAGTYTVQALVYGDDNKVVTVNGSFTIKDTQDTKVSFKILDNKFGSTTVAAGFADPTKVEVYYDGIKQDNSKLGVSNVKGVTVTGGGAYIKTVDLYVEISGSNGKYVKLTLAVNDQLATVTDNTITE